MKEAVTGELEALALQINSAERESAVQLEHHRQEQRRIEAEVGQCNKLIFILGQMVSTLEDINEALFLAPKKTLGHPPAWDEIGALVGGPPDVPKFIIGEYTFFLEENDPTDRSPEMLARIYHAEANFQQVVARLDERSRLWHEYNDLRAAVRFNRGETALPGLETSAALIARLKEHTAWLAEDIPQWIRYFKELLPELYKVLVVRYPGRRFIRFWPASDPNAPPL
jgi:hypothetical protein